MPLYSLDGRSPTLPPEGSFWIAPNACVIGDVVLGQDVGIWFGAVLRGDNEPIVIGARTNIQECCTLHTDMGSPLAVGEECTIGHNVILHGCTIGDGALIGMGAIVLNGARIGRGCLVGAGALVTEGKTFDDHSLIMGSPARATGTLDQEAVAKLRLAAAHYVANWRRFAARMKPIDGREDTGAVPADNSAGSSFAVQMAVLDVDLDDEE
jgi:carbonic anhydrase/acetyltransferase-like protein (isoleucine patch superfamily)